MAETGSASTVFGLYPLLTRELARFAGGVIPSPATPGLVLSWIAFALAMVMMQRVAQLDTDGERAEGAALLAAVFPFASVFGKANGDALFLLFALTAFYGVRQGQWIIGGIGGALATAMLPAGILMLPALALSGWRAAGANRKRLLIALGMSACGFAGYLIYLYYLGGPPGGWAASTAVWGYRLNTAPWTPIRQLLTAHLAPTDAMNVVIACVFLIAVPVVWWRFDGGYALYMLAMLWIPLVSGRFDGLGRTCALLFPVFVIIAGMRWRLVLVAAAITSAMFYALALAL
jgi:Gpi18-like mannosyltransferase